MLTNFIFFLLIFTTFLFSQDTNVLNKKSSKKSIVKVPWIFVNYGIDIEHWIDADREISHIASIKNYPLNQERPKTFQSIKAGGLITFSKRFGLYMELPLTYNRVEPFYDSDNTKTSLDSVVAIGDNQWGLFFKWLPYFETTFSLILPSIPFQGEIWENRAPGAAWAGLGVVQGSLSANLKIKRHFLNIGFQTVFFDPWANSIDPNLGRYWVIPGDANGWLFYNYSIKYNSFFSVKPSFSVEGSRYHWTGKDGDIQWNVSLRPGIALSFLIKNNREISLNTSWVMFAERRLGGVPQPNIRGARIGLYYGIYK